MSGPEDTPEVLERFHANLDLVDAIARPLFRTLGRTIEFQELQSLGRAGLLRAAQRFDPSRSVPFRSYATYRVRGSMLDGVRKISQLPRRVHERLRVMEAGAQYGEGLAEDVLGPAPPGETQQDARRQLDEHLAAMATAMAVGLVARPGFGEEAGEQIAVEPSKSPEDAVTNTELFGLLVGLVSELPPQEQELVRRHYFDGERFDHIAEELGLSKSWASRLHARAMGRLSKRLRAQV